MGEKVLVFGGLGTSSKERFNELWSYNMKGKTHSHLMPRI
jgi:hypothetical protein